jgi:hypothetical protein
MEYIRIDKQYYCGVDLHANIIYICVMRKSGKVVLHEELSTDFSKFLKAIKPYLSSIAVCAESSSKCFPSIIRFRSAVLSINKNLHAETDKKIRDNESIYLACSPICGCGVLYAQKQNHV